MGVKIFYIKKKRSINTARFGSFPLFVFYRVVSFV